MAQTYRYSDVLSIVSKTFPRIVEDQFSSICSNLATNLIWYGYDWRQSLKTLPPFWLAPGMQDYNPPLITVPSDFGGLRQTFLTRIASGGTVRDVIKAVQDLQITHVVGFTNSITYNPATGGFRIFPRAPWGQGAPYLMIEGTYKCKPTLITNSTLDTLLPFDDMYLNTWLEVMRWAFMSASGDQRAGQVLVQNGSYQITGQLGAACNVIDQMAAHEGLLQNDPTISPAQPLSWPSGGVQGYPLNFWGP